MIHHGHKFIFIHIPKCGGTSIETAFNGWKNSYTENFFFLNHDRQHYFVDEILQEYQDCKDYFKFTFVRNPWKRAVSEYLYVLTQKEYIQNLSLDPNISFKDFYVNNLNEKYSYPYHGLSQHKFVFDSKGNCLVDFIGKLENFQTDFNTVCDKIGIPQQQLPHIVRRNHDGSFILNKSTYKHYTEYYDEDTKQIVADKFAKDIEHFGYKFV